MQSGLIAYNIANYNKWKEWKTWNIVSKLMEYRRKRYYLYVKLLSVGNLPQEFCIAYGTIMQYLSELREKPTGMPFGSILQYGESWCRNGFSCIKSHWRKGKIKLNEIPAGKQISLTRRGSYKDCEPAYKAIEKFIKENGYTSTGLRMNFILMTQMKFPKVNFWQK